MPDSPSFPVLFRVARDEVMLRPGRLKRQIVEREGTDANILVAAGVAVADAVAAQQAASMALGVARRQTLAAGKPAATSKRESDMAVYLQVEYETLDGRRFFPTHQQLGYKEPQPGSGGKSSSQVCSM